MSDHTITIKIDCNGLYCGSCKYKHQDTQSIRRRWCDIFHDSVSEQLEYFVMDTTGDWLRDYNCIMAQKGK
jgi:hypothetical protein